MHTRWKHYEQVTICMTALTTTNYTSIRYELSTCLTIDNIHYSHGKGDILLWSIKHNDTTDNILDAPRLCSISLLRPSTYLSLEREREPIQIFKPPLAAPASSFLHLESTGQDEFPMSAFQIISCIYFRMNETHYFEVIMMLCPSSEVDLKVRTIQTTSWSQSHAS